MDRRADGTGAIKHGYVVYQCRHMHRIVVERVIGKSLPSEAVVHHVDGNRANNRHTNLVVCPDDSYHMLIHQRERALDACGNPDWRKCPYCGDYDNPSNMSSKPHRKSLQFRHLSCVNSYNRALRASKKGNQSSTQQP